MISVTSRVVVLVATTLFLLFSGQSYVSAADVASPCLLMDNDAYQLDCFRKNSSSDDHSVVSQTKKNPMIKPSLTSIWELNDEHNRGTFHLQPYRANYFLPVRYSNRMNLKPNSPAEDHSIINDLPLNVTEAKFQFSVKFKVWETLFKNNGDLWFGYTQQSNWQLYNGTDIVSAAFRETNYEPEVILTLRTDRSLLGWHWRMLNIGFLHQSNGRELPLSRSWNRLYGEFGLERGRLTLNVRPWLRVPEKSKKDDNSDIRYYLGSSDTRLTYVDDGNVYSILGRYSMSGRRGALQLDWAFPISGALKGYVQLFSGYGESLIDYNHSQTVLGVGVLLVPWQ